MTNEEDEVRLPIRVAASEGGDLRARVRDLVLRAIVDRKADPKAYRAVLKDAVEGLGEGFGAHAEHAGESLRSAVGGLDEAMGKSLYALQTAVEEAWDNGRRFADADLREAYDAVRGLEDDLVGTLKDVGGRTKGVVNDEFTRLGEHFGRNGTDTGTQIKSVLDVLGRGLGGAAKDAGRDLKDDAREAAGRLSAVTSGILRGLADALDGRKP
ncbi:hypothetical protein EZJ19_14480 [Parasulfuritortus cantonensis]|uniref:Uncharacterized protein n=1 Tax=Parasulfuritortus cantonensis TaxID=2528202 RepID=A0A4R1B7G2_9PROT|nr:DUF6781 family protein [Parasulfuritortus cantonensis]TCJ11723.1 hypothetical protein EZJ19_14480 [Parasulfuritortus cantonensis]